MLKMFKECKVYLSFIKINITAENVALLEDLQQYGILDSH